MRARGRGWRWDPRPWVALLGLATGAALHAQAPSGPSTAVRGRADALLERTVALVGGAVVTRSDVEVATTLGLVVPDAPGVARANRAVIDRWLMLHEVARFAPPEPDGELVQAGVAAVRARAGGERALGALLARGGFTLARLTAWVRDDLRIAAYLDQRFASTAAAPERRRDLIAEWLAELRRRTDVVEFTPERR